MNTSINTEHSSFVINRRCTLSVQEFLLTKFLFKPKGGTVALAF